jgi:hypothetical protein
MYIVVRKVALIVAAELASNVSAYLVKKYIKAYM